MTARADSIWDPVRAAADRAGLTDFLRWWGAELAAMIPVKWRERFTSRGIAYVATREGEWRVLRPGSGGLVEAGRSNFATLDFAGRRAAFRRLTEEVGGGALNVWLVLDSESVLVRKVVLPLAAEEALRDAVGFELDRLTPYSSDVACFDQRVTGRDVAAQRLELELAVTPRAPVVACQERLRELGATVLGVGVANDLAIAASPFNLLAAEERERPATSRAALAARVLAGLAAAMGMIALAYPLWQKREAVIGLQPRVDRAKAGADVADRLAAEIEKLASEHNFLLSRKQGLQPAVTLVEDLSRLLPDTTWVQQLDIRTGQKVRELQIAGETGSSPQLIEVLEKSGSLTNASFKSPLTKGVTPGTERFLISAEVKPRPLPDPIPEAALSTAPPAVDSADLSPASTKPAPVAPPAVPQQVAPPPAPAIAPPGPSSGTAPSGAVSQVKPAMVPAPAPPLPQPRPDAVAAKPAGKG